jgi:hypothetical protein
MAGRLLRRKGSTVPASGEFCLWLCGRLLKLTEGIGLLSKETGPQKKERTMRSLEKKLVPLAVLALATVLAPALAMAQNTHLVKISFEGLASTALTGTQASSNALSVVAVLQGKGEDIGKGILLFSGSNGASLGNSGPATSGLGTCNLEGDGALLVKTSDGGSSFIMDQRGVSCTVGAGFGEVIINAAYSVRSGSGTGRYSGTTGGTGNVVVHIIDGQSAEGHLDGNIIVMTENDD